MRVFHQGVGIRKSVGVRCRVQNTPCIHEDCITETMRWSFSWYDNRHWRIPKFSSDYLLSNAARIFKGSLSRCNSHHHHHVPEGLGVFLVSWSSRWSWSLHLFLGRPMFFRPFGLYCSTCFGSLFVSILCTCCSHFFWYCFISFTTFCAPVFCLVHWYFSLSSFVIPSKCLKNYICAASKRCSLFSSVPKLHFLIAPFILLYVCNLSSRSLPYSDMRHKLWSLKR